MVQTVRIFLASSSELAEHRREFELFIGRQNKLLVDRGVFLKLVMWEDFIDAMDQTRLQDAYNKALKECELFVMLFRTKVGKYTAEEFEKAFGQFKATGWPRIWTYFNRMPVDIDSISEDDFLSLKRFQKQLLALGHFQNVYENHDKLCGHFHEQLDKLEADGFFARSPAGSTEPSTDVPQPTAEQLRPYLTRRNEHWRSSAAGKLDQRFVNLTLMFDHGLEYDGPRHEAQRRFDLLAELLATRPDVGAWVLVGSPGAGKSTVLQHHEMATAEAALGLFAALKDSAEAAGAPADQRPEVCIWHRLSEYSFDSPAPDDWLALPTRWPQGLPPWPELLRVARVRFLLDGLNEIKASDRSRQLQAIQRWTDWAAAHASRGDLLAPVFSVRTLDQSPLSSKDFEVRQIVLSPWEREQIEAYCATRFGADNALWPVIEQDTALLELSALPFNLWAQCKLFNTLGRPARDRAELMSGMFWQMLSRRTGDAPLQVEGLLGDEDRQLIASGAWKETLRALPERHGCLVPWLDETLQRLHRRGRQVSVTRDELLAGLTPRPGWAAPADWLHAVRSLELIGLGGHDEYSTEPLLRCTHQLWQEFFAARGIRQLPTSQPEQLPDLRAPALPPLDQTLAKLGTQEPLPGPDPSHWEEPVKLAVQLVRDPLPWLRVLEQQNLALAGRAAVACRDKVEQLHGMRGQTILDGLRQALLARSRDPQTDLRLRIEAGLVLGELGDPRFEERQGPHGRYLWPKQWVQVPGGVYRIGDDSSSEPDEKPEVDVTIEPFEMVFAPVTNAEYRCFIEAGGYQDEQWWQGETARRWLNEGVRNEAEIERMGVLFAELRQKGEAWIAARPYLTEVNREWYRERSTESEVRHAELLDFWYGAKRFDLPQEWLNPLFNASAQPVVGICQFEALAFARWLQAQSGQTVRLPTEVEWEAAACGPAALRWPWGDADPQHWQINADPAHLRGTSPVGVFAQSDMQDGLTDMAGNVWEWTTSLYTERLDEPDFNSEPPEGLARRVVHGGSWNDPTVNCRAPFRDGCPPVDRYHYLGFRLVLTRPIQRTEP
ncbi:MAG: formylglycine-generating enzyme family protein [Leptothrix sp. (in: b-proteobacteria)]